LWWSRHGNGKSGRKRAREGEWKREEEMRQERGGEEESMCLYQLSITEWLDVVGSILDRKSHKGWVRV